MRLSNIIVSIVILVILINLFKSFIDKDNIIQHVEYVSEIAEEPDYDAALNVIKSLL